MNLGVWHLGDTGSSIVLVFWAEASIMMAACNLTLGLASKPRAPLSPAFGDRSRCPTVRQG